MFKYLLLLWCFVYGNTVFAQHKENDLPKKPVVTNDSIWHWKDDRAFSYVFYLDSLLQQQSLPAKASRQSAHGVKESGSREGSSWMKSDSVQLLFTLLALAFIGFIVYYLLPGNFLKRNKVYIPGDEAMAQVQVGDYTENIRAAEAAQKWNEAIRYYYLQLIQALHQQGLIFYTPDKTNSDYARELSRHSLAAPFNTLTWWYHRAWFGKISITPERYTEIRQMFLLFHQKGGR